MEGVTRRQLLTGGGGAALVAALFGQGVARAQEDKPRRSPWALTVDVVVDLGALDPVRQSAAGAAGPTGPFWVTGAIYPDRTLGVDGSLPEGAQRIGTYTCWGWIWDPARPGFLPGAGVGATQSFHLTGHGELVASGVEDHRFPITGGTGRFRGANGQADAVLLAPGRVRVIFDIAAP